MTNHTDTEPTTDPLAGVTAGDIIAALETAGIPATVEQTGGNCATIVVGDDLVWIGPGSYNWAEPAASNFDVDYLPVGTADEDDFIDVATLDEIVAAVVWQWSDVAAPAGSHLATAISRKAGLAPWLDVMRNRSECDWSVADLAPNGTYWSDFVYGLHLVDPKPEHVAVALDPTDDAVWLRLICAVSPSESWRSTSTGTATGSATTTAAAGSSVALR
jgi:hypothetical protein